LKLTRIFFVTDVHGSTDCWKKFINAGKFYEANALLLGGDMTGKGLVTIVKMSDGTVKGNFRGKESILDSAEKLEKFRRIISMSGYYPYDATETEIEEFRTNPDKLNSIFLDLMKQRLSEWMKFADERLKDTGVKCYVCPGNDDLFEIDEVFTQSSTIVNASGKLTSIDDNHEVINLGWSNPTPWKTPRECSEEELAKKIEAQVSQLKDVKNSIFQLHPPPFESQLDVAPKLDESLKVVYGESISVGSTAVRDAVMKYQPLLGLFGHIHESDGAVKMGRTLCINPGSVYTEGVLKGAVINLDKSSVKSYYSITG